jgi:hypothetical protein
MELFEITSDELIFLKTLCDKPMCSQGAARKFKFRPILLRNFKLITWIPCNCSECKKDYYCGLYSQYSLTFQGRMYLAAIEANEANEI